MKIIVPDAPNLRAECIFVLNRLFAHLPEEPYTIEQIALELSKRHSIPYPMLKELFAPLEAIESELVQAMSDHAELLEPFFFAGCRDDNWLAWAFFTMEHYGIDLTAPNPAVRRRLLALMLNCNLSLTDGIEDMAGLLRFLSTFPCDNRTKWVCTQVWEAPGHYYSLYQALMERATCIMRQHLDALLPLFQETRAYIHWELEKDQEPFITQFGLPDSQVDHLLITPTFGGFNGTGIYCDHTTTIG